MYKALAADGAGTSRPRSAVRVRRARADDAPDLARLIVTASDGVALRIWRSLARPGQAAIDVGIERARRESGGFSYRNADVAEIDGRVIGMVLAYAQPADPAPPADGSPLVLPLARLEAEAPGSWYVNGLAVDRDHRGRGLGRGLLQHTLTRAQAAGCRDASLIVFATNERALALYRDVGFREVARRPPLPGRRWSALGELLLLTAAVTEAPGRAA